MEYKTYYMSIKIRSAEGEWNTQTISFGLPKNKKFKPMAIILYEEIKKGQIVYKKTYDL